VPFTISAGYNSARVFSLSAQLGSQTATVYSYETSRSLGGFHMYSNFAKENTAPAGTTADYQVGVVTTGGYSTTVQFACQGLPAVRRVGSALTLEAWERVSRCLLHSRSRPALIHRWDLILWS
jgi:hypothetical protein